MKELNAEQRRQFIDTQQVFGVWRTAEEERRRRFVGSMRWANRSGTDYLLRKINKAETSLGPRSAKTEATEQAFQDGRRQNREHLEGLSKRLDELAPINVAMGLGRIPEIAARILRIFDEQGLLGEQLLIVGTNAIYGYEAKAGVQIQSSLVATGDIDLLYDARPRLTLAFEGFRIDGLVGLLRKVDRSFSPVSRRAYRASNRDGYLVDLIRPEAKDVFRDHRPSALTDLPDDLEGAAVFGLDWLINSPRLEAIAIDARGYPVRLIAIDPRAYALHKAWLSSRQDRDPLKAKRDMQQAEVTAAIATRYLRLSFDSSELSALPKALRELTSLLLDTEAPPRTQPNW